MSSYSSADYRVRHKSTIPANSGEWVDLFVREYNGTHGNQDPKPVLMLHGRSSPAVAGYDLVIPPGTGPDSPDAPQGPDIRYSWAQELARDGFDVFLMDLQGSGLSPRPTMDDPCNANPAQQATVLVPFPLAKPCPGPPPYAHQLGNSDSEWAELDTVVKFIQSLPGRNKPIDFIGWSAGAFVMGPYVLQHPGNVGSLLLLAPIFPPNGRWSKNASKPFGRPPDAQTMPVSTPAVTFGFPMNVGSKTGFKTAWDAEQGSPEQREDGMVDRVWAAFMANDPEGAKWGPPLPDGTHEGVLRYRNTYWWGWNTQTVPIKDASGTPVLGEAVPVLIIYGDQDTQANTPATLPPVLHFSVPDLYEAVPGVQKLMFRYAGAGHSMVWERMSKPLHDMSKQWLKNRKVEGLTSGSYFRDIDGDLTPLD
ncbi:alpha/beta fold hydrolase [Streptomyces sp. NPDC002676]